MATVLLLDGSSLTYRAFFALPADMATASGQVTNAVFGFTSMLINLLRDHQPDAIAVAWDRPEPTFRHEAVPTYKEQREEAPDILRQQLGLVRQVLDALRIRQIEVPGYEADDIIATLATQARDRGDTVIIVTGDRDTYQLVEDPCVKVLYNRRGVSDYVLYDEAGIEERTGVHPTRYVEYAALRGDPSDNLPGVPGVGEKTAAKLINTYGGLDGIFEHVDEQTPKLRENLAAHEAQVRTNAEVMVLRRDLELDTTVEDLTRQPFDPEEVRQVFNFLEFRALYDRLAEAVGADLPAAEPTSTLDPVVAHEDDTAGAVAALEALAGDHASPLAVAAAWSGAPGRSDLDGLALVTDAAGEGAVWIPAGTLADERVTAALAALVGDGGRPVVTHHAKALIRGLWRLGVDLRTLELDTELAAYLLDPAQPAYPLADLLPRYTGIDLGAGGEAGATAAGTLDLDGTAADVPADTARHALAAAHLYAALGDALDAQNLRRLHDEVERPLVRVLARMEEVGVGVDVEYLRQLNAELAGECSRLERAIQDAAGVEFNVNSTPQLREVLFDRLGLTPQKKTKTGFSTDHASLEKLLGQHPIIELLLRYREVEKLRSTYGEGLAAEVGPDGRIHATFNQTVARTGRLSSDAPNLHNIPVRTEEGRRFRRAFVPAPGFELLVADYNQIELRVIAHLAEDPGLIAAFESGEDIHTATAARIFGLAPADVRTEHRSKAKMVSYGLAYGMEAYGLGQRLGIPTEEAAEILGAYFEAFPNVRAYMERTVAEARERGYTETLMGRRRPIPELSSPNYRVRQAGERQAMNAGIQGLAADIFKVALVNLDAALEARGAESRLILQVHDEVILEVPPAEHDEVAELTRTTMATACELRVPLVVNLSWGASWADAKD